MKRENEILGRKHQTPLPSPQQPQDSDPPSGVGWGGLNGSFLGNLTNPETLGIPRGIFPALRPGAGLPAALQPGFQDEHAAVGLRTLEEEGTDWRATG